MTEYEMQAAGKAFQRALEVGAPGLSIDVKAIIINNATMRLRHQFNVSAAALKTADPRGDEMSGYRHKEAYCLMWYACDCGHRERIWNSRDGVTPFGGLLCVSCGSTRHGLSHTEFRLDQRAPNHALRIGQLFFRDGTAGDAITIIKKRINTFAAADQPIPDDIAEILLEDACNLRGEWQIGWPMLDRWDQAKANNLKRQRKIDAAAVPSPQRDAT